MCGITGIIRWQPAAIQPDEIDRMTRAISHRGPDGVGFLRRDGVALGHRRLAIIDPELGHQPMADEEENIWLIYNGEMYNFPELRDELAGRGHRFVTHSDTEVVIHAYQEWGAECVRRFRGMFAFALADFRGRKLLLSRDHFGIKPLYYRVAKNYLAFASELSALRSVDADPPNGNLEAVDYFLRFQYIPTPLTIYRDTFKLPPANYLIVDFEGNVEGPTRYWDLRFKPRHGLSDQQWEEEAAEVIHDSVKAHLISDVPFGVFLSGGIDSSIVASQMSKILKEPVQAFSIGFQEKQYSEVPYAEQVAEQCHLNLRTEFVQEDMLAILPELIAHYGEPFGDSSAVPTWYVSRLAREHVPMVLSGDGGDEGFAGYDNYEKWLEAGLMHQARASAKDGHPRAALWWLRKAARQYVTEGALNALPEWQSINTVLPRETRRLLWRDDFHFLLDRQPRVFAAAHEQARPWNRLSYAQFIDYQTYLPCDILTKVDVASMYHGLEVRTPLIDVRVVEFAATLPVNQRFRLNGSNAVARKYLLKRVLARTFPAEFVHRKKMGFGIPRAEWFRQGGSGRRLFEQIFIDPKASIYRWFVPESIEAQLRIHDQGSDNSGALWLFLVLGIWLQQNPEVSFN